MYSSRVIWKRCSICKFSTDTPRFARPLAKAYSRTTGVTIHASNSDKDTGHTSTAEDPDVELPATPGNEATKSDNRLAKLAADLAVNPLTYVAGVALAVKLVAVLGDSDATIFILAALPVVGLTALSKSPAGVRVQQDLEAQLPVLEEEADEVRAAWDTARAGNPWFGPERPQVPASLGGGAAHLNGEAAGDYGFDPLGLATDPEQWRHNSEAELLHCRWAMLAAMGALIPEALSISGVDLGEPVWWKVGAAKLNSDITLNYAGIEGFRIAGKQGIWLIAACQLALMGGPEYARYVGIKSLQPVGVFLPGTQSYPGGAPFDPLKISEAPEQFLDQQVREIKNGRLAMVAFLGYGVQAIVTHKGPLRNLIDFAHDPAHNNIFAYIAGGNQ